VNEALDEWLAHGLDGVPALTATLYKATIAPPAVRHLRALLRHHAQCPAALPHYGCDQSAGPCAAPPKSGVG